MNMFKTGESFYPMARRVICSLGGNDWGVIPSSDTSSIFTLDIDFFLPVCKIPRLFGQGSARHHQDVWASQYIASVVHDL